MSTTRQPTKQELAAADAFFAGMGPYAFRIDPETDEFHAWVQVDAEPPARTVAKRRSVGGRRRRGSR